MGSGLLDKLRIAHKNGHLLKSTYDNIHEIISDTLNDSLYARVIAQLFEKEDWDELNDRFFKKLSFGTGGLRGRTIACNVADIEKSKGEFAPKFPAVGTNCMNFYNITKATLGLINYLKKKFKKRDLKHNSISIVIARDTRYFGKEFAKRVSNVAIENGVNVYLYEDPRSTPQLSFSVRYFEAQAGIVLTASHNPYHDNGFKVYNSYGSQIVGNEASDIINEVSLIKSENYDSLNLDKQGKIYKLKNDIDELYIEKLKSLVISNDILELNNNFSVVFTNIHGTGGVIIPKLLKSIGIKCETVVEQDFEDGSFPTVKSPNPENLDALAMGINQAKVNKADVVIGTDPDCDRIGVCVRNKNGEIISLNGNEIGAILLYYRILMYKEKGIINDNNINNSVVIKTFVTSDLQSEICKSFGIPIINTLTGFKYVGEKLNKYENNLPKEIRSSYKSLSINQLRESLFEHSKFFVFGGEESHGYLGSDFVRDKDGNGAAIMFAEVVAYVKSRGITIIDLLNEIHSKYGYFIEWQYSKVLSGAEGNKKIKEFIKDYINNPPKSINGVLVSKVRDFSREDFFDEEGDLLEKENMVFIDLIDGRSFAIRPSGTEPKIKIYAFHRPDLRKDRIKNLDDEKIKSEISFDSFKEYLKSDVESRLNLIGT